MTGVLRRPVRTLTRAELSAISARVAADVHAGRHVVRFDAEARWHRRLHRSRDLDVWLIGWLPAQGTQLHDHGGSSGAFTVVRGELSEARWSGSGLGEQVRRAGTTTAFGPRYVHDVRNLSDAPAVSVHAYSAPLTSMRFYDVDDGRLVPYATLDTDDPETPAPPLPDWLT